MEQMTQEIWSKLSKQEKEARVDPSDLSSQLIGKEGWRVEVEDIFGEKRRFIVGKSTGWKPCHLELHNRRSRGGTPADKKYKSVSLLYKIRG